MCAQVLIPILPQKLASDFIGAPVPFVIGVAELPSDLSSADALIVS